MNGAIFYDALEDVDVSNDVFFVNIGGFTIGSDEPHTPFVDPDQGHSDAHGKRLYRNTVGSIFRVFVSESEDDESRSTDSKFWDSYFSNENICHHIYQGMTDYAEQYNITPGDIKKAFAASEPHITTPTPIDVEAMRPFLCWMPIERICKTFQYTT